MFAQIVDCYMNNQFFRDKQFQSLGELAMPNITGDLKLI